MKTQILDINGKKKGEVNLPKCFSAKVREDVVAKVIEAKKNFQPYGPMPLAGSQYSASGKIVHRRHVWKSQYGRGMSRIPRKKLSQRGTQFNWVGATVPNTRGGRRAHPPKVVSMLDTKKINKKELKVALWSALSATAVSNWIVKRYAKLSGKKFSDLPLVVDSKFAGLKTGIRLESLKKILGKELYEVALKKKSVRSGKGKMRGRKYKRTAGLLFVVGKKEKIKTTAFDVVNVKDLSVVDLANGGLGRLTIYTEEAIKSLGELK